MWGIGLVFLVVVLPVSYYLGTGGTVTWFSLAFFPILIAALIYGLRRGQKQATKFWDGYKLIIDGDNIKRIQDGLQDIALSTGGISKVIEAPGQGMTIIATNNKLKIEVPAMIEDYQEIRSYIEERHPIESKPRFLDSHAQAVYVLVILLAVGLLFGTLFSNNIYVVIFLGSILLIGLVASLILTLVNANVPKQTKRQIWLVVFPILILLARIIFVISANQ